MKITENDFKSALPDLTTTMRLPELGEGCGDRV